MKLEDEKEGNIASREQKKRAPDTNLRAIDSLVTQVAKRSDKRNRKTDLLVEDELCQTTKIERECLKSNLNVLKQIKNKKKRGRRMTYLITIYFVDI